MVALDQAQSWIVVDQLGRFIEVINVTNYGNTSICKMCQCVAIAAPSRSIDSTSSPELLLKWLITVVSLHLLCTDT